MYNPLVIFTGAALATLVALMGVTYDKWSGATAHEQGIVNQEQNAQQPATAGALADMAEPAPTEVPAAQSATELASIAPQEPVAPRSGPQAPALQLQPPVLQSEPPIEDSRPTFDTIRIERDGSALIAGRGLPESAVTVMLDGQPIGSATSNSDGAWVFIPDEPIPSGDHQLTLRMQMAEDQFIESQQSIALMVSERTGEEALVVLKDPDQPSRVLQKPQAASETIVAKSSGEAGSAGEATPDEPANVESVPALAAAGDKLAAAAMPLTLGTVDYNDSGDIIFSGTTEAGASVRLYVDNHPVGEAIASTEGVWSFAGNEEIAAGTHSLRVDQLRSDGSVSKRIELPFVRAAPQEVAELTQAAKPDATDDPPRLAPGTAGEQTVAAEQSTAGTPSEPSRAETGETDSVLAAAEPPAAAPAAMEESVADPTAVPSPPEDQVSAAEQPTASQPMQSEAPSEASTAASAAADPAKPRNGRIVIQPGNSLWRISRVIYGRGIEYTVIYDANKDQIRDPDLIYPGQIFATPGATPPEMIDPYSTTPLANTADAPTSQD